MDELTRQVVIDAIRAQYLLHWGGTHGLPHWERVRENGLRLAASTEAARSAGDQVGMGEKPQVRAGMRRLDLRKAFTLIEPGPVVLVTTFDGKKNNMSC